MNVSNSKNDTVKGEIAGFFLLLKKLINLRADTDKIGTVESIKANIEFRSANAWTLVFAIFIASVGLNVNSTAVVIGAMLISPLMGPIVGVGFALGTYDFTLLKNSSKNLAAAVIISLTASTIYFLISPLSEVQSELLARTRPSFFDVIIAFFGGAAGIVAISRKEKGNAIPGVAIATALMPPLCTAGFGLALRNWSYFFGAMYLFVINSVFISISTLIFVRSLRFHDVQSIDPEQHKKINRWISYVGAAVLLPSFFMAWYLQQESYFNSQANKFIAQELRSDKFFVVAKDVSYSLKKPKITVSLLGEVLGKEEVEALRLKAHNYSLSPDAIEIHQSSFSENLEKKIGEKISAAEGQTNQLQLQLKKYELEINELKSNNELSQRVTEELLSLFPEIITHIYLMRSPKSGYSIYQNHPVQDPSQLKVIIQWHKVPPKPIMKRATAFLQRRLDIETKQIIHVREF